MDYLTKAREICPKELCGKVKDSVDYEAIAFNRAFSLCLPIVADLLKRVDELESANDQLREINNHAEVRVRELEEEVHKIHLTMGDDYGDNVVECMNIWRAKRDCYKKLLEVIANDWETSEHLRKVIQKALEGKR